MRSLYAQAPLALLLTLGLTTVGCNESKSPKPPGTKRASGDAKPADDDDWLDDDTTPLGEDELELAPIDFTGLTYEGKAGERIELTFEVKNAGGRDVLVAMMVAPSGARIEDADTTRPVFVWESPRAGTEYLQFLIRDMDKCRSEAKDEADCEIKEVQQGSVGLKDAYGDVASVKYKLEIKSETSSVGTGTGGLGTGGLGSGSGGGFGGFGSGGGADDLIQQITDLLGGGGGGIDQILQGLGGGDLQQILDLLQNGGGGGGLDQLLDLLDQF